MENALAWFTCTTIGKIFRIGSRICHKCDCGVSRFRWLMQQWFWVLTDGGNKYGFTWIVRSVWISVNKCWEILNICIGGDDRIFWQWQWWDEFDEGCWNIYGNSLLVDIYYWWTDVLIWIMDKWYWWLEFILEMLMEYWWDVPESGVDSFYGWRLNVLTSQCLVSRTGGLLHIYRVCYWVGHCHFQLMGTKWIQMDWSKIGHKDRWTDMANQYWRDGNS